MDIEERVKTLEAEINETKEELNAVLLDLRAYILEMENPLRPFEPRKKQQQPVLSEKGVDENGNRKQS